LAAAAVGRGGSIDPVIRTGVSFPTTDAGAFSASL
jgi:hypothetical protein